MKNLILLLACCIFISNSYALKVVTFNTTCDFCGKGYYDKYSKRKKWIVDTLKRLDADVVALQEVRTSRQLKYIRKKLDDYGLHYSKFKIVKYADPAFLLKKGRFEVLDKGGRWLGPKGDRRFTLGWKTALPRRLLWLKVKDLKTKKQLYLVTSHFDNRKENKEPSAKVLNEFTLDKDIPIIFAGDTNLRPHMNGYKTMMEEFDDSFDIKEELVFLKNSQTNANDSCNLEKAKIFPACRVDHILLSKNYPWKVLKWGVDQYKYGKDQKFTSDHRAYFAEIDL